MTITVNSLGANSADFTYTAGETAATLITSIGSWVTSHGWTVHDAANNVYKALCFDGITYKYAQLFAPSTTSLIIRVYETWSATTHVGANEVAYATSLSSGGITNPTGYLTQFPVNTTTGGIVVMLVTNRYMLLYTKDNTNMANSTPHGCIEWSADFVGATTVPFGWMWGNSLLGQQIASTATAAGAYYNMISPVRIIGLTSTAAAAKVAAQAYTYTSFVASGPNGANQAGGIGLKHQLPISNNTVSGLPQGYTIDVNKQKAIATSSPNGAYTFVPDFTLGRIYGVKLIAGLVQSWIAGDTCTIAVDANGFQVLSGGTNTDHHTVLCDGNITTIRIAIPE